MKALLIVDVQNDFVPGGALAVPEGDQIVPLINTLMPLFSFVVASQDWHPADHISFADNHEGKNPGDRVGEQILWPRHCVQNSVGAELVKKLDKASIHSFLHKGTDSSIDSYSAFFDNNKQSATELNVTLKEKGVDELYVVGLATDYCVQFTVLDALSLGYRVTLLRDACRAVNLAEGDEEKALASMHQAGATISSAESLFLHANDPALT